MVNIKADVRNDGVSVSEGPRQGTEAVTAAISVDGDVLHPRIVVYPDRYADPRGAVMWEKIQALLPEAPQQRRFAVV